MSCATSIDGKKLSQVILKQLAVKIQKLKTKPGLAAILVGEDAASHTYVRLKEKAASAADIYFEKYLFSKTTSQIKILNTIKKLNASNKIQAILVQLPLPEKFNTQKIIDCIDNSKDVDGFKNYSWDEAGKFCSTNECCLVTPPTIAGIIHLIKSTQVNLKNKQACILANSYIFADPLQELLKHLDLKVKTILKPNSITIKQCKNADVIIIAIGKPNFLTASMVKKNSIIIDVGINKVNKKLVGDVDFYSVSKKAGFITPVPGGAGPMTVGMLMKNVFKLYQLEHNRE